MAPANDSSSKKRFAYQEFGSAPKATERAVPDLPPDRQNLRVQASRKGRKGKTVTVVSGFQGTSETLNNLAKQLKTQCGTGGTVKDGTIEIQGDRAQDVVDILVKLGYKAKRSGG